MENGAVADAYGIHTPLFVAAIPALLFTLFFKKTAPTKGDRQVQTSIGREKEQEVKTTVHVKL